jgi:hypothetical protein
LLAVRRKLAHHLPVDSHLVLTRCPDGTIVEPLFVRPIFHPAGSPFFPEVVMIGLRALWMPIVLSAVIVFIASTILHMVFAAWHAGDYQKLPNEDQVLDALRPFAIPPGDYMAPRPDGMADMKSDAYKEKANRGPKFMMTVWQNGMDGMGTQLGGWFVYCLAIGVFAAYVSGRALPRGADYLHVFRFAGVTAFLAYSGALWQASIWYKRSLTTTIKSTIDGLIYALLTAGTFGWLWPK